VVLVIILKLEIMLQLKGGEVASWLVCSSRFSSLGSSPGWGQCVVFLGKTLYSHSASLHSGVLMGTCELMLGGNPAMD